MRLDLLCCFFSGLESGRGGFSGDFSGLATEFFGDFTSTSMFDFIFNFTGEAS